MPQSKNTENGNVFVIILIAVVLFGALIFTFSKSGSQGISSISKQEAKIAAQEILNYARLVEGAVDRVRRNGCSENEISFENDIVAIYTNPNTTSNACRIFSDEGGKINYIKPEEKWLVATFNISPSNINNFGYWRIQNNLPVEGIGTVNSDLRIVLNFLNADVCIVLNNLVGVDNPSGNPPFDGNTSTPGNAPQGSFLPPVADIIGDDGVHNLAGKSSFCRLGNSNSLQFNHILLAR